MLIWIIVGVLVISLISLVVLRPREGFEQPPGVRYVVVYSTTYLQMSQLKVISGGVNVAQGKAARARSEIVPEMSKLAVDGTSAARKFPDIYQSADETAAWGVDLGKEYIIDEVVYYNRSDGCGDRASKMRLVFFNANEEQVGEDIGPFTSDAEQHFTFTPKSPTTSGSTGGTTGGTTGGGTTPSGCAINKSKSTCLGSQDDKGYCSWSDARSACLSAEQSVNQASISTSQNCKTKTTKTACTGTLINEEDQLYCSWSDAKNECSYTESGATSTATYSASADVTLPKNVGTNCANCIAADFFWNPTTSLCSPTGSAPGYQKSC